MNELLNIGNVLAVPCFVVEVFSQEQLVKVVLLLHKIAANESEVVVYLLLPGTVIDFVLRLYHIFAVWS